MLLKNCYNVIEVVKRQQNKNGEASSIDNENQTKTRLEGSTHLKSTKSVVFKWTS